MWHKSTHLTTQLLKSLSSIIKEIEKLSGDAFDGTLLFTWLIKVQDKALMMALLGILTIAEKILTINFSEITLDRVRAHAQPIQEEGE